MSRGGRRKRRRGKKRRKEEEERGGGRKIEEGSAEGEGECGVGVRRGRGGRRER